MKFTLKRRKMVQYQGFGLLICLFIVFLSTEVRAQVGFKIGVSTSTFYYPGNSPTPYDGYDVDLRPYLGYDVELVQTNPQKPLLSPHISAYSRIKLSDRSFFQPEVIFSQKGVAFSNSRYENIIYKVKINYLEIPLSLSYQYLQKEKIVSNCYVGGFSAYRIGATKRTAFHNIPTQKTTLESVKDFDFGIHAGCRFKISSQKSFFID